MPTGRVYRAMQPATTNPGTCSNCGVDVGVDELRFTAQGEVCGACAAEEDEPPATLPASALYGLAALVGGMFVTISYDYQSGASLVHVDLGAIVGGLLAIGFGGKTLSFGRKMGAARRTAWIAGLVLVVLGLWSVTTGFVVQ